MGATVGPMPVGRPTTYTDELGERIAALYANGKKLNEIFREEWAPSSYDAIVDWQEKYPRFADLMSRARASHAEFLVDTMSDAIKDNPDPQKARLAIQVRQWTASKWSPRYADRIAVDVDHKVSIGAALEAGLQRAALPVRDQHDAAQAQAIEDASYSVVAPTHQRSDDTSELPDWMD